MIKNHIVYNPIFDWRFKVSKAQGSFLWDGNGKRLIDFTSGWNTANLGWNHPEIIEAIKTQLSKNTYVPSWISDEVQEKYAEKLTAVLPKKLNAVCRVTGGTEANEQAIKIARAVTGRKKIIGFWNTFHGSSYGSLSIGYRPEYVTDIAPVVADFVHLDFPAITVHSSESEVLKNFLIKLEELLAQKDIAAIVTEAGIITGWGSLQIAPQGFLSSVRKLTEKYHTLLILDEVGTGFSRLGSLFAFKQEKVVPDILTLAKAMSNGTAAIGACIVNADLISPVIAKTKVLSSLAWMPIACAAGLKALEIHLRDRIGEAAAVKGTFMIEKLRKNLENHPHIYEIRGKGLEIGIEFKKDEKNNTHVRFIESVVQKAFENGLHIVQSDENIIQLMPPLTIDQNVLEEGVDILIQSIKST